MKRMRLCAATLLALLLVSCDLFNFELQPRNHPEDPYNQTGEGLVVFWVDTLDEVIRRVDVETGVVTEVVSTGGEPNGLFVDARDGAMWWGTRAPDKIVTASQDGSNLTALVTESVGDVLDIAVDRVHGLLYWVDDGALRIKILDLGASTVSELSESTDQTGQAIDIDIPNAKVYWTGGMPVPNDTIHRSNPNGTDLEEVVAGGEGAASGIAVDGGRGRLFWSDTVNSRMMRANLDGSDATEILATEDEPRCIRVDPAGEYVYVVEGNSLWRCKVDGTEPEVVAKLDGSPGAFALFVDRTPPPALSDVSVTVGATSVSMSWADPLALSSDYAGMRAACGTAPAPAFAFDGTAAYAGTERTFTHDGLTTGTEYRYALYPFDTSGNYGPRVDVRVVAGDPSSPYRMYFEKDGTIQRSDARHAVWQKIVTVEGTLKALDIDQAAGKIYWATDGPDLILRADLDGTDVETLEAKDGMQVNDLDLDPARGKLYWLDEMEKTYVYRMNMDGTGAFEPLDFGGYVRRMVVDGAGEYLYWPDDFDNIIRSDLDGGNQVTVLTGVGDVRDLELDVAGGKIYWGEQDTNKIRRANLDGLNVEELLFTNYGAFELSLDEGKLYFDDYAGVSGIHRSNLDGSDVERLYGWGGYAKSLALVAWD